MNERVNEWMGMFGRANAGSGIAQTGPLSLSV